MQIQFQDSPYRGRGSQRILNHVATIINRCRPSVQCSAVHTHTHTNTHTHYQANALNRQLRAGQPQKKAHDPAHKTMHAHTFREECMILRSPLGSPLLCYAQSLLNPGANQNEGHSSIRLVSLVPRPHL